MSACRSCGAPVWWAATSSDRRMPVDTEPDPAGNIEDTGERVQAGRADQTVPVVRVVDPAQPSLTGEARYRPHWASCPDAARWRNRE